MKKRILTFVMAMCLTLAALPAASASDCWYYDQYGKHDFEQTDCRKATCTEDGYYIIECRQCGKNEIHYTQKAYGHDWELYHVTDATCTAEGEKHYVCRNCGKTKDKLFPALGHDWVTVKVTKEPTCTSEGSKLVRCKRCNKEKYRSIDRKDHQYGEWKIVVEATDSSMGERARYCTVCGREKREQFYPDGTLYRGMKKSDEVRRLQQMLKDMGILNDKADGIFGKRTEKAVMDFQMQKELEATGIAYPQTINMLSEAWNLKMNPEATPVPRQTPVVEATPEPMELPPFCGYEMADDGTQRTVYCENHQRLIDTYQSLSENAETDEKKLMILNQEREMLKNEIETIYAELVEKAEGKEKAMIAGAKSAFFISLGTQENMWAMTFADQPLETAKKVNETMLSHCAELCHMRAASVE